MLFAFNTVYSMCHLSQKQMSVVFSKWTTFREFPDVTLIITEEIILLKICSFSFLRPFLWAARCPVGAS